MQKQKGQENDSHGEALWRKLVEKKLFKSDEDKPKTSVVYKFNPDLLKESQQHEDLSTMQEFEALKIALVIWF